MIVLGTIPLDRFSPMTTVIKLFEDQTVRSEWNKEEGKYYFSIIDVVAVLTGTTNARRYWSDLKAKVTQEQGGVELYDKIVQLKMKGADGKLYATDCADNEGIFRIIQSIRSPRVEPFKLWLARVGRERLEEIEQPEKAMDRAKHYYEAKGYSKEWVETRTTGIEVRNKLTDQWKKGGINGKEYGILTEELTSATFGLGTVQLKYIKGLEKKESLRDNMSPMELVINMLGEASAREIAEKTDARGLHENQIIVKQAGAIARNAMEEVQKKTGQKIVTRANFKHLNTAAKQKQLAQESLPQIAGPTDEGDEG